MSVEKCYNFLYMLIHLIYQIMYKISTSNSQIIKSYINNLLCFEDRWFPLPIYHLMIFIILVSTLLINSFHILKIFLLASMTLFYRSLGSDSLFPDLMGRGSEYFLWVYLRFLYIYPGYLVIKITTLLVNF